MTRFSCRVGKNVGNLIERRPQDRSFWLAWMGLDVYEDGDQGQLALDSACRALVGK